MKNIELIRAVSNGNSLEYIKKIIADGVEINTENDDGATILHLATQYKNHDLLTILIELKADINKQDKKGNTALHYAVIAKNKIAAALLISARANPNIRNKENKTALKIAQKRNDHKMLKVLIPSAIHKIRIYYKKK